jgi:multimeric flavodoxin WrbA
MKILILSGSYRKNGNTGQIISLIKEQLEEEATQCRQPLEIETVFLGHQHIELCRGCRVCFDQGEQKCPLKDDFLTIKVKMQQADGILLASPVYVDDVSGITKNWIDRLSHVCHRPEFAGKSAYLIATVGSSPTRHALQTMRLAMSVWGFHLSGLAGFKTGALMRPEEMKALHQEKAQRIAKKFFQDLYRHKAQQPSFISLMMFKIQQAIWQTEDPNTVDYQYWKSQGWLESHCDYYIPHHASRVKVTAARWTGALIKNFVS